MELKKYALSDVCTIVPGFAFKSNDFGSGENIAVKIKDIEPPSVNIKNAERVCFTPQDKFRLSEGDYIMAMTGATIGKVGKLQIDAKNVYINQRVCKFNPITSVCDKEYLYYVLSTSSFRNFIYNNVDSKLAQPNIGHTTIYKYTHLFPSNIKEQKLIASVLNNIDRKIELNKLINDNLEAMAKQLYDYWFVQFDFPNEESKPYKSSGGAMVWNDKLKREIPQGWSDCVLGDYIGRITNGLNPRKNFVLGSGNNYYVTIRSMIGTTIDWNNCDRCDDEGLSKINSRSQLQIGDIIFSAIGTIGRTYYILEEPTNWNISETSFTLRAKENVPNDFFYGMLRSNEIQIKADKAAMGSTLRCLVMDSLCSLQYIEIPSYMMKLFAAKVSPLYRQLHRNNKEIAELTKQRDELLPLLMNGQASVNYHLSDD